MMRWLSDIKRKLILICWQKEAQKIDRLLRKALLYNPKIDQRFAKEINYMRECNEIMFIPYRFRENYPISDINVEYDPKEKLQYVIHLGKRLYFPLTDEQNIKRQYHDLVIEQDINSPHRYFSEGYEFEEGMIFVDVGAAEGILSLEIVEKAKAIYLFECNKKWVRALEATFRPWKKKVHIISKFVGKKCNQNCVTLDSFFKRKKDEKFFIKMDVEGMELDVLEGSRNFLCNNKVKCVCTTYHREDAAIALQKYFKSLNFTIEFSKNYILFHYGLGAFENGKYKRIRYPYFRKGLIRAENKEFLQNASLLSRVNQIFQENPPPEKSRETLINYLNFRIIPFYQVFKQMKGDLPRIA